MPGIIHNLLLDIRSYYTVYTLSSLLPLENGAAREEASSSGALSVCTFGAMKCLHSAWNIVHPICFAVLEHIL